MYLACMVADGLALPILRSSKGRSTQRMRLSTTHSGSRMLANAVGSAFSRNDKSNAFVLGRDNPRVYVSGCHTIEDSSSNTIPLSNKDV